ncbi:MAG: cellulase family glycosylhydrolase [Planctomycetia bacterium]|nr:cellulase family glycosylhydrolase [Planctomycetia bacterium]
MNRKQEFLLFLIIAAGLIFLPDRSECAEQTNTSPYGVCAHLGGGEEHREMPKNLLLMKEAGIDWARADFSWSGVERPQGQWHFDHLDRLLDEADKAGLKILPILNYDVPWATPAYKHLDAWKEYVSQLVSRYKDRIRYWEVWNEENLKGFWRDDPKGESYAVLLKETYQTIKKIDPDLVVVYGGLAGVPHSFFEDSLKAGAGSFFDIINIHPYRGGLTTMNATENLISDIKKFNELLRKYGTAEKPIWITEMGWASLPQMNEDDLRLINAAIQVIFPKGIKGKAAVLIDPKYPYSAGFSLSDYQTKFPKGTEIEVIGLDQIGKLDPVEYPVFMLPPGELYPSQYFEDLYQYVKRGGSLFLTCGVPLYYQTQIQDGALVKHNTGKAHLDRNKLRIGWKAWWTEKNTPDQAPVHVSSDAMKYFPGYQPVLIGSRFLTDSLLKEGDTMIPLLTAKTKDFEGHAAVVYKFNSDLKGSLLVSTINTGIGNTNISTIENQAVYLPQAILISFAAGIERYFWYEFEAPERDDKDKESHFGIVHHDLTPKPAWYAYKALTKARPAGSVQASEWKQGDHCVVSWTRPDGQKGWALWNPFKNKTVKWICKGKINEAFDYLGNKVEIDSNTETIPIKQQILYLIGPDKVVISD